MSLVSLASGNSVVVPVIRRIAEKIKTVICADL